MIWFCAPFMVGGLAIGLVLLCVAGEMIYSIKLKRSQKKESKEDIF